jgi:PAS domain S-box-containing protein
MPTMDGYELVRRMRQTKATASLPVVLFTAHYNEREARNLADFCGVARVLTKPASPEQVLQTVDDLLADKSPPPSSPPPSDRFDEEHLRVVNAKLVEMTAALRLQNSHLGALNEMNLQLASERNPKKLLAGFCRAARGLVGATHVVVAAHAADQGPLAYVTIIGMPENVVVDLRDALLKKGAFADLIADPRSIRCWLDDGDPTAAGLPAEHPPIHSVVIAPIRSLTHVYGWVCATGKLGGEKFTEEDERLLAMFAAQVGRIYENGSLYTHLKKQTDELRLEIRERQSAEAALRESEANFHYLFLNVPLPMAVYSLATLRFLEVNDVAVAKYGYSREEFLSMTLPDTSPDQNVDDLLADVRATPADYMHVSGRRHRGKDGQIMEVDIYAHDIQFAGEACRLALVVDVTERKETERQLLQAQKMEAVGQLTGGIAHDFNNILMVIMANVDSLEEDEVADKRMLGRLERIGGATQRAADLTRQLLTFSRKQPLHPKRTNINDLVANTGKLLGRTLGAQIEIDAMLADDLWITNVDRTQFETALVNLCINARDAMPGGGKLQIETRNVMLDEDYAALNPDVAAGDYAMLAVTDTGSGMPPHVLAKAFDPFFTTKEAGKGTGLGLSMVYGFIKQSQGHIKIYSEVGKGTSFKLYLPRNGGAAEEAMVPDNALLPRGSERILVVEDEPQVRASVVQQLQSLGYAVAEASDGAAGVAAFAVASQPYDLVLTDVVMPAPLNGKGLADEVTRLQATTKIVFMSGYAENSIVHHGRLDAGVWLLSKPFRKRDLAKIIRQVLDGAAGPDYTLPKAA